VAESDSAGRPVRLTKGRGILFRLGLFGGATCVLLIVALVVVHTPPVRRYVVDRVVAVLAREQIEFSTDELSYNALNASFNLRNVRIRSTAWPDAPVFATIAHVRANLSLLQLLRGRYVVQSGDVDGIDLHYVVDEEGRDNVPRPPRDPDAPSKPLDYLVSSLSIANANMRYENRAQQIDAQLPLGSARVRGNAITNRHDIQFDAGGGAVQARTRRAAIDRLTGQLNLGADDLSIEQLRLEAEGSRAEVSGSIDAFDAPMAELTMNATVDVSRAAPLAGIDEAVGGSLAIDATMKGPLRSPAIDAHLSGSSLQYRDLRDVELDANAAYDVAARSFGVTALQVRGPWGDIAGAGSVSLDGGRASRVQADITNVDAASVMRALRLPYVAATQVNAKVQAEWPGVDYLKAVGTAEATLRPTASGTSQAAMPLGGRIVARADGTRLDTQLTQLEVPGAEINGQVVVTNDRLLQGELTGRSSDVARLTSAIEAFTARPRGSLLPVPISGGAQIEARLGGSLETPSAATTVNAQTLDIGGLTGVALTAEASYAPGAITIGRAALTWQEARVQIDGRVGLGTNQPIRLDLSADNIEVASLLQAVERTDLPLTGTLVARGTVSGTTARPIATITVQGSGLVAYEEQVGSLEANVGLEGRELTLSQLVVTKPQPDASGRLTATGTYNLDRSTYTFELQSQDLRLLGMLLPDGRRVRGTIEQLAARGSGTVSAPEGTLDLVVNALEILNAPAVADAGAGAALPAAIEKPTQQPAPAIQLGRVVVNAVADNKEATITASSDRFNLDANALIGLAKPFPATVKLRANNLDLGALPLEDGAASQQASRLQGQLRATIDASGNLTEPARGQATVALDALEASWNGRPVTVTSQSPLRYANERLTVEKLDVAAGDVSLTLSGELPLTDEAGTGEIDVNLHGSLATLTLYLPAETELAADGAVALAGSLRGTLKRIDPELTLTVDNGVVISPLLEPGFSDIVIRARVENGEANIERLDANWGTATLQAAGRIPLEVLPQLPVEIPRMSGPATLKASVTGLDPASIPGASSQLGGRVSAEAAVMAASADPAAVEGQVTFQELEVAFGGLNLAQQQPSMIGIRAGAATIEQLDLSGSAGKIQARGTVGLVGERTLNIDADGNLNIAALSLLTKRVRVEGDSSLRLTARGTVSEPDVTGTVDLTDARAVSEEPNVAADNINAHLDLEGRRIVLTSLDADLNGGTLTGSGSVTLGEGMLSEVNLDISTQDFAYDAPLDLRSVSDSTIHIGTKGEDIVVSGQVTIEESGLTGDINFDSGLLAAMASRRKLDLTEERNPFLERVRFNVDVNTSTPVLVDNNLGRAEVNADLTVAGTPYETGLLGELTIVEGSEIRLNERRYEVERGVISFVDERRISPSFDLRLNTTVGDYDVMIAVTGTPGDTETTMTSAPTLPEPDIMALLVTGRTLDEMRGQEYEVAQAQVLSYLAGRVGSSLGRGLQQATGFSEVRIEPTLIANETDPSARLTVGQDVTDDFKLVYSANLTDSNDQIWVAEYDVTRRFQTRGVRQEDSSYRLDFRHDVRFGGVPEPRRTARVQPKIAEVNVTVPDTTDETAIRKAFRVKAQDRYDFFEIRNGIQRVERSLIERGYLQSRVRLERRVEGDQAHLTLRVAPGPRMDVEFMGATPPKKVQEEVRTQWHRGVFDKQRGDDSVDALREWLMEDKFLQAKIEYQIQDVADGQRRVLFQIQPGPRSDKVVLAFEGASGIAPDRLDKIVNQQRLERQLFTDPVVVTELLQRYYREQGYLSAEIDEPRFEFQGATARVALTVREGPRFSVRNVAVSGNTVYATDAIVSQLPVIPDQPFAPAAAENALEKIRELYWAKGYNDVRSDYAIAQDRATGLVDLAFTIAEGPQSVIAGITIGGNDRVSDHLVRQQIQLAASQPLDLSALARSRKNLYDTGAFSVVDITRRDSEAGAPAETAPASNSDVTNAASQTKPVDINVNVREVQPVQIRYGASYDTERGVGGLFDISNHNSLGGAREIGLHTRYDGQVHEGRIYINQPPLTYLPKTTGALYIREEVNPPTELTDPFDIGRKGMSVQLEQKLRDRYNLTYGYKLEWVHTLSPSVGDTVIDESFTVSPVTATLTRDTRDEVLDASRGAFLSHAFSYSPSQLGSDQPYLKYLGQYFHYFPLRAPTRKPFTNEIIRPRLVYAVGLRVGLGWGMGNGVVPRSERYYAGGSATMRGFAQNAVGPIDPDRNPLGGEGMLIINNELRMPLVGLFDGVVFADIGNVFPRVRDFFSELRQSAGIGLRIRTPWVLLRTDYGFVLDPRPGESRSRFYFSIGQAF
jgi:outer membrane protein assembly complex protein YaeT